MTEELIRSFTSELALREYARVNGFDNGEIEKFVSIWNAPADESVQLIEPFGDSDPE